MRCGAGDPPPAPNPAEAWLSPRRDDRPDLFRALLEVVNCLAFPEEVMSRPR